MNTREITFILHGRYESATDICISNLIKLFPKSKVILSTYRTHGFNYNFYKKLKKNKKFKLIFNKDAGEYNEFTDMNKNFYRLISTTKEALYFCKTKYAMKLRTDFIINKKLVIYLKNIKLKKKNIFFFNKKIEIDQIVTNKFGIKKLINYHLSDQIILTTSKQMKEIFFINKKNLVCLEDFTSLPNYYFSRNSIIFSNEQLLWINFFKKKLKKVEKDMWFVFCNKEFFIEFLNKGVVLIKNDFSEFPRRIYNFRTKIFDLYNNNIFFNKVLKIFYKIRYEKKNNGYNF